MACTYFKHTDLSVLSVTLTSSLNRSHPDLVSLSSHVIQLEQMITDLKAKLQVQEQTNAAVLSSVLSKLTTATDELTALRLDNDSTVQTLAVTNDQLKAVQLELNTTQANLSFALGHLKTDVRILKGNVSNIHQTLPNCSVSTVTPVYFELISTVPLSPGKDNGILKFDTILLNKGNGYDQTTGIFETPASGIYLFWVQVLNTEHKTFHVRLHKDQQLIVQGFVPTRSSDTATITYIMEANKGEKLWFTIDPGLDISPYKTSYYGGMLLQHF